MSDFLVALSVFGAVISMIAIAVAYYPLASANGTRPTIHGILLIGLFEFLWAGLMAYNAAFNPSIIPNGGIPLAIVVFARVKPVLVSGTLMFMIYRLWFAKHNEEV